MLSVSWFGVILSKKWTYGFGVFVAEACVLRPRTCVPENTIRAETVSRWGTHGGREWWRDKKSAYFSHIVQTGARQTPKKLNIVTSFGFWWRNSSNRHNYGSDEPVSILSDVVLDWRRADAADSVLCLCAILPSTGAGSGTGGVPKVGLQRTIRATRCKCWNQNYMKNKTGTYPPIYCACVKWLSNAMGQSWAPVSNYQHYGNEWLIKKSRWVVWDWDVFFWSVDTLIIHNCT